MNKGRGDEKTSGRAIRRGRFLLKYQYKCGLDTVDNYGILSLKALE